MKKQQNNTNYLERIPCVAEFIRFSVDSDGIVTLEYDNKGFYNLIAQKLLKKPKVSYVHLDRFGSFVWQCINGEADLIKIGSKVREEFGDEANPLYERLTKFFQVLNSYGFVKWKCN